MGLEAGDYGKAAVETARECYRRILAWHTGGGTEKYKKDLIERGRPEEYHQQLLREYQEVLHILPPAESATEEEMQLAFRHAIAGDLEWAHHMTDALGVKTAAYAHVGERLLQECRR